jgi:hypothetical protein
MLVGAPPQDPADRRALRVRKGTHRTGLRGPGRGGQAAQANPQAEEAMVVVEWAKRDRSRSPVALLVPQVRPRAHDPLPEANSGLDHAPVQAPRAGRSVDVAGARRLRPAQVGARPGRRQKATVGATATAPAVDPDPRAEEFCDTLGGGRYSG